MRIEKDKFGKCKLEDSNLYGIQTVRIIDSMSFSGKQLSDYPELIAALAQVKQACASANYKSSLLDEKLSNAIISACNEILDGKYLDQFPIDVLSGGGGIAFNTNFNEVVSNVANKTLGQLVGIYDPVHPAKHVNASQSDADVMNTSFRLAILSIYEHLESALDYLVDELKVKEEEFESVTSIARTALQDALPAPLSSLMEGYNQLIWRRRNNLASSVSELNKINLSGTVVGTGYGTSEEYRNCILEELKNVSGRDLEKKDSLFDAAQNSDDLASVANQLKQLAFSLVKIAKDLRLLASGPATGFNELLLPSNQDNPKLLLEINIPAIPEGLINCSTQVIGYCQATETSLAHGELNLNMFETTAAINILDATILLTQAIESFVANCIQGLKVNSKACQNNLNRLQGAAVS